MVLALFVFAMLGVDALLLRKRDRDASMAESAAITAFWFFVALQSFAVAVWHYRRFRARHPVPGRLFARMVDVAR